MIFDISPSSLVRCFGEEGVVRVALDAARASGLRGEELDFVTSIGLPENDFVSFGTFHDSEAAFAQVSAAEREVWNLPAEAESWVMLGNFEISALALDVQSGQVHQLAEGIMRPVLLHRDLSSLVYTILRFTEYLERAPEVDDDDEESLERREEETEAIKRELAEVDPLPFASEYSEWREIVGSIGAGIWA